MYAKCTKCGSEKTHSSRVRPGERTVTTLFLRPIRCRQCKERFWVQNPNAYVALGSTLTVGALLIAMVWLVIEQNMSADYIAPVSEVSVSEESAIPSIGASAHDQGGRPNTAAAGVSPLSGAQPAAGRTSDASQTQSPTDDHYFTVRLYQESAENGNSDAQYKLGLLHLTGNGALQDFAEAAKWLKLSADQGYGLAQYELGLIYRTGHGLAVDQVQSYVWLNLAAAAGVQQAGAARDDVMRTLSGKQLAQAQKISREWLAARSKPKTTNNDIDQTEPKTTQPKKPSPTPLEDALPSGNKP